jgi:hypothetical protein
MKRTFRWVSILLGSICALDAEAVPRPKPGSGGAAGQATGAVTSAPLWVIVVIIIAVAILLHQFITRRKR